MEEYTCSFPRCAFTSATAHGIDTHAYIAHRTRELECARPTKQRRFKLTVPRSLHGTGDRLAIDRVTRAHVGADITMAEECDSNYNRFYTELVPEDLRAGENNLNENHESSQSSPGTDAIVDAFLHICRVVGDRRCDELLKAVRENISYCTDFFTKFASMSSIRVHRSEGMKTKLRREGFSLKSFHTESGLVYSVYWRDPVDVLRRQVERTPKSEFFTRCGEISGGTENTDSVVYTHPMNSEFGTGACAAAEDCVKKSLNRNVCWKIMARDGEQSAIAGVQVFSDKSHMSLDIDSLAFHPLHATFVNFSEDSRRKHITSGCTVVAYLPVRIDGIDDANSGVTGRRRKVQRVHLIQAFHNSICFALKPLMDEAMGGFIATSADKFKLRLHLVLASYICDIPEAEDSLSVKRGNQTESPCFRCLVRKGNLADGLCGETRTLAHTKQLLTGLERGIDSVMEDLKQFSMLSIPPVLSAFPMIGVHPCVDIYDIFRFEPMHNLSLGVSKMLKDCATIMLRDENRTSPAMITSSGAPRTFKHIRRSVLHALNDFLCDVEKRSPGYGIHCDYSKGECGGRLNGFFTETGIVGMLEAKEYDSVDMVSPFLGAIIDACCGLTDTADVTQSYTDYADLVDFIYRRNDCPGWTEEELSNLSSKIAAFKLRARSTFARYQPSSMGTVKWHLMDHIVADLRAVGGVEYLHGGIYEESHKLFKEDNRLTSRRKASAMAETIKKQEERALLTKGHGSGRNTREGKRNATLAAAVKDDCARLVRSGIKTTLAELEAVRSCVYETYVLGSSFNGIPADLGSLAQSLGDRGMLSFIRQLRDELTRDGLSLNEARTIPLCLPASAYLPGIPPPTLSDPVSGSSVYVPRVPYRIAQRVVAKAKFYGSTKPRQDGVMIASSENDARYNLNDYVPVWFAKAMCFVRILRGNDDVEFGTTCTAHRIPHCDRCSQHQELCFVQYFEVVSEDALAIDGIDASLRCIRVRWHRTPGERERLSCAPEFGLAPVESIRGLVHYVRADFAITLLCESVQRKLEVKSLADNEEDDWPSHLFYVNRFYKSKGGAYESADV